jgi:hypothetical protein
MFGWWISSIPDDTISAIDLQPYMEGIANTNFSLLWFAGRSTGIHTYYVLAEYDTTSTGTGIGDIAGMFTLQFIADPIPSKVVDPVFNDLLTVYPNPTNGQFNIQSPAIDQDHPVEITLLNTAGQSIHQQTVSNINQYHGDLINIPAGEYLVRVRQGNRVGVKTIVKAGTQK